MKEELERRCSRVPHPIRRVGPDPIRRVRKGALGPLPNSEGGGGQFGPSFWGPICHQSRRLSFGGRPYLHTNLTLAPQTLNSDPSGPLSGPPPDPYPDPSRGGRLGRLPEGCRTGLTGRTPEFRGRPSFCTRNLQGRRFGRIRSIRAT
jgi:hypothetical protein